jgi:hypothetical protein
MGTRHAGRIHECDGFRRTNLRVVTDLPIGDLARRFNFLPDQEWSELSACVRNAAEHMAWPEKAAELLVTFKKLTERAVR